MNRRSYLSTAVVGTGVLSGCLSRLPMFDSDRPNRPLPDVPTGGWTQYGADGANTFAPNVSAPPRGNLAWTSEAISIRQPSVSDGVVYTTNFAPSTDGSAIALDAQDGTEQWRTTLDASGDNRTVIVDGQCIVAYGKELVALDTQTGDRVWTKPTSGLEELVADEATGTVLVASVGGIEAFRASNGERRWEIDTVDQLVRAPAVYDGRVFAVGQVDGTPSLIAFSLADGSERWRSELRDIPASAPPVAIQEGVFVSDDGTLVVHDRETGDRRRELRSFGEDRYDAPETIAVDNGTVFVTSGGGAVVLDSETGTERWHLDIPVDSTPGGLCVGTEMVVFPIGDPEFAPGKETISAFDRESGALRWHYAFDPGLHGFVTSPPVLVDGAVLFTSTHIDSIAALGDVPELDS